VDLGLDSPRTAPAFEERFTSAVDSSASVRRVPVSVNAEGANLSGNSTLARAACPLRPPRRAVGPSRNFRSRHVGS